LSDAGGLDALDEVAGNLEVDVGGEECRADFFERVGHVGLGEAAYATEVAEGGAEFVSQGFKHGGGVSPLTFTSRTG